MSNRLALHRRLRKPLSALFGATALLWAAAAAADPQPYLPDGAVREVTADPSGYGGAMSLPIGGTKILRFSRPIGQVMIGNPKVGDVIPLSDRTIYVLARTAGTTNVTVMGRGTGAQPIATLDLHVGYDIDGLQRSIRDIMPGEPVEVSARGDGIVLTGLLSSSAAAARAAALAERFAPEHVVNLTRIKGAEQVMLSVRVAEVQRSALKELGVNNFEALWDKSGTLALAPPILNSDAFANLVGKANIGKYTTVQGVFDALEQNGFASTLAEPNLVALSGETAVFLAGGEYPIPVPQGGLGGTVVTIEYKQYGVSIAFTPTVYGDTIDLLVAPEVSALDYNNALIINNYKIPGLTTRRAKTTVELRDGQSFAIAGLLRREYANSLRGLPGAQDLPIFGQLFRDTKYQNNETEVVIIVTAHLAQPTTRENLLVPTDTSRGPTAGEIFFNNLTDAPRTAPPPRPVAAAPAAPTAAAAAPAPPQS